MAVSQIYLYSPKRLSGRKLHRIASFPVNGWRLWRDTWQRQLGLTSSSCLEPSGLSLARRLFRKESLTQFSQESALWEKMTWLMYKRESQWNCKPSNVTRRVLFSSSAGTHHQGTGSAQEDTPALGVHQRPVNNSLFISILMVFHLCCDHHSLNKTGSNFYFPFKIVRLGSGTGWMFCTLSKFRYVFSSNEETRLKIVQVVWALPPVVPGLRYLWVVMICVIQLLTGISLCSWLIRFL